MSSFFDDVLAALDSYYDDLVAAFPKLILCILLVAIMWPTYLLFMRRIRPLLRERIEDKLLARFVTGVVKSLFVIIGLILILKIMGFHVMAAGLWGTAGAGAFVVGFALKDIFEHFLAGFLLALSRPFRIGDSVELDGNSGTVVALNMRNTHIKSFDGKDIYIPNGNIIKKSLKNFTIDGYLRFDYELPLEFSSDINRARSIILKELDDIHGVLTENKKPFVTFSEVGSRYIAVGVYYWVDLFDEGVNVDVIKLRAAHDVINALQDAGYYIPGKFMEVHKMEIDTPSNG